MKKLAVAAAGAAMLLGGWKLAHREHATDDRHQVIDRLWVDHMPKNDRDMLRIIVALSHAGPEENIGFLRFGSRWHAQMDGFRFTRNGDDLAVEFPQNSWKATWHTKVSRCSVGDFTLCLEVTAPRGTFHYFSRDEWVIKNADDERALEAKLLQAAPAATNAAPAASDVDDSLAP